MLARCVTLCERLHCGGDLGAGGDCRSRCVRVRVRRGGCVWWLSSVGQLVWREVDNAIGTRAVQAAEDIQALVLTPVEVQTEDGREDEEHHCEIKHNHNGRLGREIEGEKQCENRQKQFVKSQTPCPSWGESGLLLLLLFLFLRLQPRK